MQRSLLGAMIAVTGALLVMAEAQAQGYGYDRGDDRGYRGGYERDGEYGYGRPPGSWREREEWERRLERREARREFWRQQRELEERRAYEAGRRDAYRGR